VYLPEAGASTIDPRGPEPELQAVKPLKKNKKGEPRARSQKDEPVTDPGMPEAERYDAATTPRLTALIPADESAPLPTRYWILDSEGSEVAHLLECCPAVQASDAPLLAFDEDTPIESHDTPHGVPVCGQCLAMFEAAPPLWLTWERGAWRVDVWSDRVREADRGLLRIGGSERVLPLADLHATGLAAAGVLSPARLDLQFTDAMIEVVFDDDAQAEKAFEDLLDVRPDQRRAAPQP
jgi:hypothetical protein